MMVSFREAQRALDEAAGLNRLQVPAALMKMQQRMVLGISVAQLPGVFGVISYVLSGDLFRASLLILVALVAGVFFRPRLPRNLEL